MNKFSILFLILPFFALSQEEDFQIWNKIELTYKVNKKLSVNFVEGFRLRENASIPSKTFSNLKIGYRQNKKWRLAFGYRFIQTFDIAQDVHMRHRWYADVAYRKKIQRFSINFRSRILYQIGINHLEQYYRGKLSASYNIRKTPLEPSLSIETFCDINALDLDKMRYTLTAAYPIGKKIDGFIFYRLQREINTQNPTHLYIIGTGASLDF